MVLVDPAASGLFVENGRHRPAGWATAPIRPGSAPTPRARSLVWSSIWNYSAAASSSPTAVASRAVRAGARQA